MRKWGQNYDGNNSLYLKAYTTTVSGSTIYTGDVSATGSTINSYPAYKSNSCTVEFSGDKKMLHAHGHV